MTRPECIDRGKLKFRLGKPDDVEPLLHKYGAHFFHEAGFDAFSAFDLPRAAKEMRRQISQGDTPFILAEIDGETVGMVSWTMSHIFTAEPIAVLWMMYVMPQYRRGPVGRLLLWFAVDLAKQEGACAFFATIAPTSPAARRLCNLFRRCGFEPMGGALSRAL
jgi:GNAT superfamily N-acetyltransferase